MPLLLLLYWYWFPHRTRALFQLEVLWWYSSVSDDDPHGLTGVLLMFFFFKYARFETSMSPVAMAKAGLAVFFDFAFSPLTKASLIILWKAICQLFPEPSARSMILVPRNIGEMSDK